MDTTSILIAFLTGLTTGGLSCFAVQGGLLTSSIAAAQEKALAALQVPVGRRAVRAAGMGASAAGMGRTAGTGRTTGSGSRTGTRPTPAPRLATGKPIFQPILLFLTSKLIVHILFGFLLGWAGSLLTPSPVARGLLQLGVGLFMVGNALRLLNVHPIFRAFTFEPPRAISRLIRRKAKDGDDVSAPVLLGALTVLIPCGITQIVMVTAIGSGSPWMGAALLGAFVLGASPTFFGVTYLAARISALFEKQFMRVLAVFILLMGLYSVDTGLNLAGSPYSVTNAVTAAWSGEETGSSINESLLPGGSLSNGTGGLANSPSGPALPIEPDGLATPPAGDGELGEQTTLRIDVFNAGYSPNRIVAPAGKDITVTLVTKGVYSCSRAFVIPALNYQKLLPDTGEVSLVIPAQKAGTKLPFMCSMGMFTGQIIFQ